MKILRLSAAHLDRAGGQDAEGADGTAALRALLDALLAAVEAALDDSGNGWSGLRRRSPSRIRGRRQPRTRSTRRLEELSLVPQCLLTVDDEGIRGVLARLHELTPRRPHRIVYPHEEGPEMRGARRRQAIRPGAEDAHER